MKIKIDNIIDIPPYERAIYIRDANNGYSHEFVISSVIDLSDNTIEIYNPVGQRINKNGDDWDYLIELPAESSQGRWRIWITADQIDW